LLCCKSRSLARRHRSRSSLRRLHQHQHLPRMPRRRPRSTPGTPCKPCRLSWISGGSRRTLPKGKASATATRGGRRRTTSHPMTHRFATSSRCPRSQLSSRVRRGPVVSTPILCPNTTVTTIPRSF
jgi:hypothetical protein